MTRNLSHDMGFDVSSLVLVVSILITETGSSIYHDLKGIGMLLLQNGKLTMGKLKSSRLSSSLVISSPVLLNLKSMSKYDT